MSENYKEIYYDNDLQNFFNEDGDVATHDEKIQWAKENPEVEMDNGKNKIIPLKNDINHLLNNVFTESNPKIINEMSRNIIAAAPIKSQPYAVPQVDKQAQAGLAGLAKIIGGQYGSR